MNGFNTRELTYTKDGGFSTVVLCPTHRAEFENGYAAGATLVKSQRVRPGTCEHLDCDHLN